jgi:hypothetical protein
MILQATPIPLHFDLSVLCIYLDNPSCAILKHGKLHKLVLSTIPVASDYSRSVRTERMGMMIW